MRIAVSLILEVFPVTWPMLHACPHRPRLPVHEDNSAAADVHANALTESVMLSYTVHRIETVKPRISINRMHIRRPW